MLSPISRAYLSSYRTTIKALEKTHSLVVVTAEILHQRPDLVRISGVLDDVFDDGQNPGRVHPQRLRHPHAVDLDRLELVEVEQHFRMTVEKFLPKNVENFFRELLGNSLGIFTAFQNL